MQAGKFIFHQYSKLMYFYQHQFRAEYYKKKYKESFRDIRSYVMFLGYPRSGHTLLGAMMNAHPDMLIAHEYNSLQMLDKHSTRDELFAHLIAQNQWFLSRHNKWTGYSYNIPSSWQGKFSKLQIIGDKRGGASSRILHKNPEKLDQLAELVQVPVKLIIVHRNPFDNIATRARGGNYYKYTPDNKDIQEEIDKHFNDVETISAVKKSGKYEFIEMNHEEFISSPKKHLEDLCRFLDIESCEQYINNCVSIVRPSYNPSRHKILWTDDQINQIKERSSHYDFLKGYTFER